MSTILIISPLIVTGWPLLTAAITASVMSMGYAVVEESVLECNEDLNENSVSRENLHVHEEMSIENSEILADARNRGETLTIQKDNVKVTFHRDIRGTLRLTIDADGLTKREVQKLGDDLIGRVTQQYSYNRLVTEMKERGMTIVEEDVEADGTVKMRVRN
ncbi:MAG: DUF1257 domain-containing protein [Planctomycetaceae bacterium]|jgi:hypothetical protein|nr:DUF1257 domain-containing protein [Planctomycetaceae bacterium]